LDRLLSEIKSGGPGGYGVRRGAAYGVAGIVKGLGIASLKGFGVLEALKSMVEDKKHAEGREGSLQAFECLCEKLGRLFEPYVIHILPLLLQCFGDSSPQVGGDALGGRAKVSCGSAWFSSAASDHPLLNFFPGSLWLFTCGVTLRRQV
jgi:hypothetical protein